MAETEPKSFILKAQEAPVRIEHIKLHQDLQTDRDARTWRDYWVSGSVAPDADDFESIALHLEFVFLDGDKTLGSASVPEVVISAEQDAVPFECEDRVRGPLTTQVTRIDLTIHATVLVKSKRKAELVPEE